MRHKRTMSVDTRAMRYILGLLDVDVAEAKELASLMVRPDGLLGEIHDAIGNVDVEGLNHWTVLGVTLSEEAMVLAYKLSDDYRREHSPPMSASQAAFKEIMHRIRTIPGEAQRRVRAREESYKRSRPFWKDPLERLDEIFGSKRKWESKHSDYYLAPRARTTHDV